MKTVLAAVAVAAASVFAVGWALMVVVGVIHGEWLPQLPTMGYGAAVSILAIAEVAILIRSVFGEIAKALGGDS